MAENKDLLAVENGRPKRRRSQDLDLKFTGIEASKQLKAVSGSNTVTVTGEQAFFEDGTNSLKITIDDGVSGNDASGTFSFSEQGFDVNDVSNQIHIGEDGLNVVDLTNTHRFDVDFNGSTYIMRLQISGSDKFIVEPDGQVQITDGTEDNHAITKQQTESETLDSVSGGIAIRKVTYMKSDGDMETAEKTTSGLSEATKFGVVKTAIGAAETSGVFYTKRNSLISGFSGLTINDPVYLNSSGDLVQSLSGFSPGEHVVQVGMARSSTVLEFDPHYLFEY